MEIEWGDHVTKKFHNLDLAITENNNNNND